MNIPYWIWYVVTGIAIVFSVIYAVGTVLGIRNFNRMSKDFDEQRDRVRGEMRRGARRT